MAIRTTSQAVRAAIETDSTIDVEPFIRTANALTNKVSSADSDSTLDAEILFEIETYLAAHFYALRDPQYLEKKTGDASAVFQGRTGMKLDSTLWGQMAIAMDLTGFLASVNVGRRKASLTWLGKPPSEQTPYQNRD